MRRIERRQAVPACARHNRALFIFSHNTMQDDVGLRWAQSSSWTLRSFARRLCLRAGDRLAPATSTSCSNHYARNEWGIPLSKKTRGLEEIGSTWCESSSPRSSSKARTLLRFQPTMPASKRIIWIFQNGRWLKAKTGSPRLTSSDAMPAWRSENVRMRSGSSASIFSKRAEMNDDTFGLGRASGGRSVYPEIPTTRCPSPRR